MYIVMARSRSFFKIATVAGILLVLGIVLYCCNEDPTGPDNKGNNDTIQPPPPDTAPPHPITDPSLTYSLASREALLKWTAPCDDSIQEAVSRYEIRYSDTELFKVHWDIGIVILDPPVPSTPGLRDSVTIRYPKRGKYLYAAIKSFDEEGNHSKIDSVAGLHIPGYSFSGLCNSVYSGLPIEGLSVRFSANGIFDFTLGADGRFLVGDQPAGAAYISISSGTADSTYHALQQSFDLVRDIEWTFLMIPVRPLELPYFPNVLTLLEKLLFPTHSQVLLTWAKRPVKCHIPPYVNQHGIDYQEQGLAAAQRWMDRAGYPLFVFVDSPPDTGVTMYYKPPSDMGIHLGITRHTNGSDGRPLRDDIDIVNTFTSDEGLYKVMLHELGHTLRFGHLPHPEYIMFHSQPLPPDISDDEIDALRLFLLLPNHIDMGIYGEPNL